MTSLQDAVQTILTEPTPQALVALQGALLTQGQKDEAAARSLALAGRFFQYLSELQSKITAKQYSELASRLDIGAVGALALENIVAAREENFWRGFLLSAIGEGLMVAASRQYIKIWEAETCQLHSQAAWTLTEELWHISQEMQPDLPPDQRWQAIQALLAPAHDPETPAPDKAALLGHIFQILLLTHLAPILAPDSSDSRR